MKKLLYSVASLVLFIFLAVVPETNSVFTSSTIISTNSYEVGMNLDFYYREDKHAVGFNICGINTYDRIDYLVTYKHDLLPEGAVGSKTLDDENCFKEEWIILGTSSDGIDTYFENITDLKIDVDLLNSEIIQKSLEKYL